MQVAMGLGFWPTLFIAVSIFGSVATGMHIWARAREKAVAATSETDAERRMREVFAIFDKMYMINFSERDPEDMRVWTETCIINLEELLQDATAATRFAELTHVTDYDDDAGKRMRLHKGRAFLKSLQSRLREQDIRTFYSSSSSWPLP